ncbi:MAG: sugar ABC transporter permease [Bifidobacteriaceae bacterium]|nr:sugar ABC transporter permease [Bifidobacteriaceae bacterium]
MAVTKPAAGPSRRQHHRVLQQGRGQRRSRGQRRYRVQRPGYAWVAPAVVISIGLLYFCLGDTAYTSTLQWDGVSPNPEHVGLRNYSELLHDPIFWRALRHCAVFLVITFTIQTSLGIAFAALLHSRIRLASLYKVIIFIPVVLAPSIMAPVFRLIFAADGQFNWVLRHIGLGFLAHPWLGDERTSLYVIMFIQVWEFTGLTFILYYGAMSQVDHSIIEAARLDGAGNFRTLVSIVLPIVKGTTVALLMLSVIGALKIFDIPQLVTLGGPNYSSEFLSTYIYRHSIPLARVGFGAAASMVLLVLAVGFSMIFARLGRRGGDR